jgi:hypothetical protein
MSATTEINALIPVEKLAKIESAQQMVFEFLRDVESLKITTPEENENASEICKKIKKAVKELEEDRIAIVKPLKDQTTKVDTHYRQIKVILDNGEAVFKRAMAGYFEECERKRIEAQRIIDAEIEAKRKIEEEKALKELEKAETYKAQGREDMAEKAEARAETAMNIAANTTARIVTNQAKVAGVGFKKEWRIKIVDAKAAKIKCSSEDMLTNYVELDIKGLEKLANTMKRALKIDGLEFYEETRCSSVRV